MEIIFIPTATAFAVPLFYWLLNRYYPSHQPRAMSKEARAEFVKQYRWVNFAILPFFFLFAPLFTIAWAWGWFNLLEWHRTRLPAHDFLWEPIWIAYLLPSIFLGIVGTVLPLEIIHRLLLGAAFGECIQAEKERFGFDLRKIAIHFLTVASLLPVAAGLMLMNWYALFNNDGITIKRFLNFQENHYTYDDVAQLVETSHVTELNGKVGKRTRYTIIFHDGTHIGNEDPGRDSSPEEDKALLEYVGQRSGKLIQQAKFLKDVLKQ